MLGERWDRLSPVDNDEIEALQRVIASNVTVLPHLRWLPLADVQIGAALLDDDGEELVDVGHFLTADYADGSDGEIRIEDRGHRIHQRSFGARHVSNPGARS